MTKSHAWTNASEVSDVPLPDIESILVGFTNCFKTPAAGAIYVSTPITTGPHFVEWYSRHGENEREDYARRHYRDVVDPNIRRARPLVEACRARWSTSVVIDPTGLESVPTWEQSDYHQFWTRLISDHVSTVVFGAGWQYSTGCALEFATAVEKDCRLLDHDFRELQPRDGILLLHSAINDLARVGLANSAISAAAELAASVARNLQE